MKTNPVTAILDQFSGGDRSIYVGVLQSNSWDEDDVSLDAGSWATHDLAVSLFSLLFSTLVKILPTTSYSRIVEHAVPLTVTINLADRTIRCSFPDGPKCTRAFTLSEIP